MNGWTRRAGAALVGLAVLAPSLAFAQAPPAALPPRPGQAPAAKIPPAKTDEKKAPGELTPEARALKGAVIVERAGQALALGGVLGGDGRVLTALSPLGAGNDLSIRFPDNTVVKAKIGHNDRAWDLALLVPQSGKWKDGLIASSRDPVRNDATIRSFTLTRGKPTLSAMSLRSHKRMLGGDDRVLENAIEIGSRVNPLDLGSPIIDEEGKVVGVLGRGCMPAEGRACTPVAFGAPMQAIRSFLRTVPATAVPPSAWLGIQGVGESFGAARGVRVVMVHPESPADEAKLHGGDRTQADVIVAVDGTPVGSPEALADAIRTHGIGEKVPLLVLSGGKYKTVTVHLRAAPEAKPQSQAPSAAELPSAEPPPVRRYYP